MKHTQTTAKIRAETHVVVKNFRFSFGLTGEAGSPPPGTSTPASWWLVTPIGRMVNSTVHQMTR